MNSFGKVIHVVHEKPIGSSDRRVVRMPKPIHVLSVGPVDRGNIVHDAMVDAKIFRLSIARDYRGLWMIPKQEPIDVVILHNAFTSIELEGLSRFVRRRWPYAAILIVHFRGHFLEDALYDDRVGPTVAPELLLSTIERLAGRWQEWRSADV